MKWCFSFLFKTLKTPPTYLPCRDEVVAAIRKCTERLATTPMGRKAVGFQFAQVLPTCLPACHDLLHGARL